MKKTEPLHISKLLRSNGSLNRLTDRAHDNEQLLVFVRSRLPDPLGDHCISAVLSNQTLTLFVDSASWITRLRFFSEQLKTLLLPLDISFQRLKVKVFHPRQHRKAKLSQPRSLSDDNAALIRLCAENVSEPELRDALLKLGTHKKRLR